MFTRFLSTLPKKVLKRPPTDTKFLLKYDVENEKWFSEQLQSYEVWPEEVKGKVDKITDELSKTSKKDSK